MSLGRVKVVSQQGQLGNALRRRHAVGALLQQGPQQCVGLQNLAALCMLPSPVEAGVIVPQSNPRPSSCGEDPQRAGYFGANRIAPSSRITSPLSMSFSMMCLASLA